jgi:aspartyl protease family protein
MVRFAIIAGVAALAAVAAARAMESYQPAAAQPDVHAEIAVAPPPPPQQATGYPASISKAADGHYWAEGDVNGYQVRFLVDTGASAVALTADDARRLGINPNTLDYKYSVATANGDAKAAAVKLASVSVAGARVNDVDAFVMDHGLDSSLLGMTYLGRLSSFEATPQALILKP